MTVEKKDGDNFAELLKSLQTIDGNIDALAKAMPDAGAAPDDKKVVQAAAESDDNPEDEDEDGDGEGETFGKSVTATGADGKPVEAVDATDLIKSLIGRLDTTEDTLAKSVSALAGIVGKQNDLIKSLQSEIKSLGSQGRGRKTQLMISEKPGLGDLAKSAGAAPAEDTITAGELLAKSEAAWNAGKISGAELTTVDVCLRSNSPIDPALLRKIALA